MRTSLPLVLPFLVAERGTTDLSITQDTPPTATALRITPDISLDGTLDDEAWAKAVPIGPLVLAPNLTASVTVKTNFA